MLGLISGAVTPLGLLNDREHTVPFWLEGPEAAPLGYPAFLDVFLSFMDIVLLPC